MSYYMGDYRGDFYRGDPGLFSLATRVFGFGKRVFGAIRGAIAAPAAAGVATTGIMRAEQAGVQVARRVGGTIMRHPVLSAAGAAGVVGAVGGGLARAPTTGVVPRGFRISAKTGRVVRVRRIHVTNVKALRRSLRRIAGFARIARRVLHFTHPRAARGRPQFRFKRKRKMV